MSSIIDRIIRDSDIIIEVVDSRAIDFTRSLSLEKKIINKGKLLMIVAMKSDLVEKSDLEKKLKSLPFPTAYASYKERKGANSVRKLIYILSHKVKKEKRIDKVKVGLIGYTNVGKSSLINLLTRAQKAKISPLPAYTKKYQWIKLKEDILLIDTAGIINARRPEDLIVFRGNVNPEKQECFDHALLLLTYSKKYKNNLKELLKIEDFESKDPVDILREYAIRRKFYLKNGEEDLESASKEIVRKWNKGEIKMFIEHPLEESELEKT